MIRWHPRSLVTGTQSPWSCVHIATDQISLLALSYCYYYCYYCLIGSLGNSALWATLNGQLIFAAFSDCKGDIQYLYFCPWCIAVDTQESLLIVTIGLDIWQVGLHKRGRGEYSSYHEEWVYWVLTHKKME